MLAFCNGKLCEIRVKSLSGCEPLEKGGEEVFPLLVSKDDNRRRRRRSNKKTKKRFDILHDDKKREEEEEKDEHDADERPSRKFDQKRERKCWKMTSMANAFKYFFYKKLVFWTYILEFLPFIA